MSNGNHHFIVAVSRSLILSTTVVVQTDHKSQIRNSPLIHEFDKNISRLNLTYLEMMAVPIGNSQIVTSSFDIPSNTREAKWLVR